jgi:hypothetical protein
MTLLCPALVGGTVFVSLMKSVLPERYYPYYTINKLNELIVSRNELTIRSYRTCVMISHIDYPVYLEIRLTQTGSIAL